MKVGLFDSGLGGLTVLNSIIKVLKGSQIIYVADTLYAPYGEKNTSEILTRCDKITKFLIENHGIDALVIACNTATSIAIKHLREKFPFLIIIGTEPGIKPAILNTKSLQIGILATPSTLKGDKYQLLVNELSALKEVKIHHQACSGLAQQIENGELSSQKTYTMLEKWLDPMKKAGVDTIVLGCTHYPLIKEAIISIMGEDICLIETGDAIARRLMILSKNVNHINEGDLYIKILYTGNINLAMVNYILKNCYFEIGKHTI